MKTILTLSLFLFVTKAVFSQDLIVTDEGDSINCKITKVKAENIYFTFKHKNEIRNTLLPMSKVKEHQFDFYKINEVPTGHVVREENYQHFRIALNGGYSYQTAKIAENVPADFKESQFKIDGHQ